MNNIEKIYALEEKFQITKDQKETEQIEQELKELLKPYKQGLIGIAQINPIAGDIEYNSKKIVKYIKHAQNIELDLVVFPELSLTGYPIGDAISRYPIIIRENIKWLNGIAEITNNTHAIVGFLEPDEKSNKCYNSVAVLGDGKILNIIRKSTLNDNYEFNDNRYIKSAETTKNQNIINGLKYEITIGSDCLNKNNEFCKGNSDILINCSASVFYAGKEQLKCNALSNIAKQSSTPMIYVNQVGAIDNASFAGISKVYNSEGNLIAQAESFEEQFLIVNPVKNLGKIYPQAKGIEQTYEKEDDFTLDYEPDMERTYKTLIQGIKDYFGKSGFKRAVLGLSGGLDSTVCAVLLADALGKENVLGISMPSKITSDLSKNDAQVLAQNLGIKFSQAPIKEMFETTNNSLQKLFGEIEKNWEGRYEKSYTPDNIQARSRAMFLWGISNEFASCLPIATSDKSEAYMGYATINGDMSGGYAPIADITKTKLFALAKWMNENRPEKNAIPQSVIEKRPGAELAIDPKTGKPLIAEDALMPYEFLDEVIWRIENKKENYENMLTSEFLYEKTHSVTPEQKKEWLNKFYRRMASALYKKSIMPPYVIVDSPLYNFKQPITSKINYNNISQENIREKLQQI